MGRERKIRQKSIGRLRYCTNRWRYRQMVILDRDAGATFRPFCPGSEDPETLGLGRVPECLVTMPVMDCNKETAGNPFENACFLFC